MRSAQVMRNAGMKEKPDICLYRFVRLHRTLHSYKTNADL
jgi:hypothetical protein